MDEQRKENYSYSYDDQQTGRGQQQYRKSSTPDFDWELFTSWPFIVGAFMLGVWPLGVFLIVKGMNLDEEKKRRYQTTTRTTARTTAKTTPQSVAQKNAKTMKPAKKAKKQSSGGVGGLGFIIAGAILAFTGIAATTDAVDLIYWAGSMAGYLTDLWMGLTMLAAGGTMLGVGIGQNKQAKRFPLYKNVINKRNVVSFDEISAAMGLPRRKVVKDLKKMVEKGLLGSGAYLDMARGVYVANADALVKEEKKPEPEKPVEGYDAILRNLRVLNDRIEDEEISRQIDRIEEISRQIFREVERNPEKEKKISALMNGYLPTTQKLLDSYATFEEAGVDGEKTAQAKQRIAANMARIVRGFEKQLDELYSADVLDVETDIRVMENMLRRDGADENDEMQLKL